MPRPWLITSGGSLRYIRTEPADPVCSPVHAAVAMIMHEFNQHLPFLHHDNAGAGVLAWLAMCRRFAHYVGDAARISTVGLMEGLPHDRTRRTQALDDLGGNGALRLSRQLQPRRGGAG